MSAIARGAMFDVTEITPLALISGEVIIAKVLSSSPERMSKSSPQSLRVSSMFLNRQWLPLRSERLGIAGEVLLDLVGKVGFLSCLG